MTDTIAAIRKTWAMAAAAPDATARVFYTTLFRIAPETEQLFKNDLDAQGEKLMETLGFVVDNLDDADTWLPAARDLAVRHAGYGVQPRDYDSVGAALLATFDTLLGDDFQESDRKAWTDVYGDLSRLMIEAAYPG